MRFISLFAGVGGFDLGFERAGMEPAAQVEIDPKCREVLGRHWPHVERYDDVRTFDATRFAGAVDVVCGGFPCQDLSYAGRRAGMAEGARSSLFYEAIRVVDQCKPRWIVLENVPGLLTSRDGEDFRSILSTLDERGYGVAWRILDSRWFGVPQRRRRVYVVGCLGAVAPAFVALHPECEGGRWDASQGGAAREDYSPGAASDSAGTSLYCNYTRHGKLTGPRDVSSTIRASWDSSLNTDLVTHGTPGDCEGGVVRRLTPVECERLQGFPDGWTEGHPEGARYRMMGNAVTVNVLEWIGRGILAADGRTELQQGIVGGGSRPWFR